MLSSARGIGAADVGAIESENEIVFAVAETGSAERILIGGL
jgi:hypothetical protein